MDIQQLIEFAINNGFAVGISVYCLVYLNKTMKEVLETLVELKTLIKGMNKGGDEDAGN